MEVEIRPPVHTGADYTEVRYDTNVRGYTAVCHFHQDRFEMLRGMLVVPRAEDIADDGLAIFEGPGAVPLCAFV